MTSALRPFRPALVVVAIVGGLALSAAACDSTEGGGEGDDRADLVAFLQSL